jgi:arginyl-tRNA--protein-N-Asp/Glu arginylyltransferase
MIDKNYRKSALRTYGEACEICGHRTSLEVHHIDYQEHQAAEDEIKKAVKEKDTATFFTLVQDAKTKGYDMFDSVTNQLHKNDDTANTSVLCGNCHSFLHLVDYGKKLLNAIKPRIKGGNR